MHDGEIVERGTHQELLSEQGLYYNMYLLQNKSEFAKGLVIQGLFYFVYNICLLFVSIA